MYDFPASPTVGQVANGYTWNGIGWTAPTGIGVTSITATAPVASSGGSTPVISMAAATGSVDGYLTAADWTTFDNKAEAGSTAWADITGKPSTFPPTVPIAWADISGEPATYPPDIHSHSYSSLTDIPSTFAPSTHSHPQSEVTSLVTDLAAKEPTIAAGTAAQYWKGTKVWATLDKAAVGLANVDNTTDAGKPVSTAQATAIGLKLDATHAGTGGAAHANVIAAGAAGFMTGADKTKLDGVATGANNYTHPAGDGNLHVPATGTTNDGLFLKAGATAGSLSWAAASGGGGVTSVTGTAPVVSSGGTTPAISMAAATGSVNGYLTSANWTTFNGKEPPIATGTTAQYWKGDKSWATLDKTAVGLGNVDNTSDASKPVSTAQATAIGLKLDSSAYTAADVLTKVKTVDGAGSGLDADLLDGQSSAAFEAALPAGGTTSNFLRGDKTWAVPAGGGGGTPGGATTQIQYNDAGAFAGNSNATFDGTTIVAAQFAVNGITNPGGWHKIYGGGNQHLIFATYAQDVMALSGQVTAMTVQNGFKIGWTASSNPTAAADAYFIRDTSGDIASNKPIVLPGAPTLDLHAATKLYVDGKVPANKITVASTAPGSPSVNDVWIDTT